MKKTIITLNAEDIFTIIHESDTKLYSADSNITACLIRVTNFTVRADCHAGSFPNWPTTG